MARLNVYVPDEMAERAREAGLNVSALAQAAIAAELARQATRAWLETIPTPHPEISHEAAIAALDAVRDEMGDRGDV
jgi:post-segregation antitoxin (ccd killing protein)